MSKQYQGKYASNPLYVAIGEARNALVAAGMGSEVYPICAEAKRTAKGDHVAYMKYVQDRISERKARHDNPDTFIRKALPALATPAYMIRTHSIYHMNYGASASAMTYEEAASTVEMLRRMGWEYIGVQSDTDWLG